MTLKIKRGKRVKKHAFGGDGVMLIETSGRFVPPVGTGQVTGSNDAFYGCRVFKLANGTYEVRHDVVGATPITFEAQCFHSSSAPDYRVMETLRSTSGSQFRLQNSGSVVNESTAAPNGVSFTMTLDLGGNS